MVADQRGTSDLGAATSRARYVAVVLRPGRKCAADLPLHRCSGETSVVRVRARDTQPERAPREGPSLKRRLPHRARSRPSGLPHEGAGGRPTRSCPRRRSRRLRPAGRRAGATSLGRATCDALVGLGDAARAVQSRARRHRYESSISGRTSQG
ncbi:MAG: hypothetical protein MZV70_10915 [Desulfobacterales bacterium]|nr:hypothetical protein [Desulfobacterales bacterium]